MKNKIMITVSFFLLLFFLFLSYQISQNEILEMDQFFIDQIVLNGRTDTLTVTFKFITFFSSVAGIILLTALAMMLINRNREKISFLLNLGGVIGISQILKFLFQRNRPLVIYRLVEESGFSFPSGHSMVGAAFYGYIIYLISKSNWSKNKKSLSILGLSILVLGIGFSRIYLGVHYASDVLAGFSLGICYTLLFIMIKEYSEATTKNILKSFYYAGEGIVSAFLLERNMKIHVFVMLLVILSGIYFHISMVEWMICILLFGVVISAEIMNTAIETTVDMVMPDIDPKAKFAKDLAAGAVLVLAIVAAIIGLMIFIPKLMSLI